jgi:hypothetical protein
MDKIVDVLLRIKKPRIRRDKEETIEQDVGDSTTSAYVEGFHDGERTGRYNLAQKLLKLLWKRGQQ